MSTYFVLFVCSEQNKKPELKCNVFVESAASTAKELQIDILNVIDEYIESSEKRLKCKFDFLYIETVTKL